jgi:acetyl-CoA carboxylase biotin carboxyl carrier protein
MNLEEISKVAALMQEYDLSEFAIESDDMKLKIKRGAGPLPVTPVAAVGAPIAAAAAASEPGTEAAASGGSETGPRGETIDSPIVGTFYRSPAPDAESFAKEGDEVTEDSVVCIVEAMKVMNEIKAEKRGRIKRILVENATPVEYGQPLIELE